MLLDLNKLHGQREHVERTLQPSALGPDDPDYRVVSPVELSMDVSKVGADVFEAHGRVQTRLELACGRCLEPPAPRPRARTPRNAKSGKTT